MLEYGFSQTHNLPYKDKIIDSGKIRVSENSYFHILYAVQNEICIIIQQNLKHKKAIGGDISKLA